ncbi:MAG: transposase [Deltaproteobacteria bacterium]|nr:transposase [Deltaproteobacteria bacterium]
MEDRQLFQLALGLLPPWTVADCSFDIEEKRLDIHLDFPRGSTFLCPKCGGDGRKAHDTIAKTWRHLNFFEHVTYLHAQVPRTNCPVCGVLMVSVPWARPDSGFSLLFEAFILTLAKAMPVNSMAKIVGEHDTRLWRILNHYVEEARKGQDYSDVEQIGVDETSSKRGHNYVSIFVDMAKSKVLFATEGKGAETLSGLLLTSVQKTPLRVFRAYGSDKFVG